jgi:hypothetical protein
MAIMKEQNKNKCWQECGKKGILTIAGNIN